MKYNLEELDEDKDLEKTYYKCRWIKEKVDVTTNGIKKKIELEQQLIVTYSIKYRNYLRSIRNRQVERTMKAVDGGAKEEMYDGFYAVFTERLSSINALIN